jgi:sRNA-binding protein
MSHDQTITTILELLVARWPSAFSIYEARRRPLKVGIHLDVLAALGDAVTPDALGLALKVYVANRVYRSRLIAGAVRINLTGEPAGIVSEAEATQARPKPKAVSTPKPIPQTSVPPVKRLSSLADLRAAAAARKAVMS